jgi:two-component system response regulator HydG
MSKVLCVDDEHEVLVTMCRVLEGAGHTVSSAESARDAVAKILSNAFDAVITDWRLGDADGRVVLQAVRNQGDGAMPVLVFTAYKEDAITAPEPFADMYLEKPVEPEELITILEVLLKNSGRRAYG